MPYQAALVTGATGGIGSAIAKRLPTGTALLLTARNELKLGDLQRQLGRGGRTVEVVVADLRKAPDRKRVIRAAEAMNIDLLVNNAGVGRFTPFLADDLDDLQAVVELNCVAPLVLTRSLLPGMIERARGAKRRAGVITLSSLAAMLPVSAATVYSASKAFDLFLGEGLASELAREPVDFVTVCPGPVDTPFVGRAGITRNAQYAALTDPDTVARQALRALGRRGVIVPGLPWSAAQPIATLHELAVNSMGRATRLIEGWFR